MKVNCLSCGHSVGLDDVSYGDYQGEIKCFVCGAVLAVKTEEGSLKSVKFVNIPPRPSAEKNF